MSNPDIPLLTDIVADPDSDAAAHTKTQQLTPPQTATPLDAIAGHEYEEFAVFEPDRGRSDETAAWHSADDEAAPEPAAENGAQLEIVEASAYAEHDRDNPLGIADVETVIAELQTSIAADTFELTDRLMRAAFADLEARVFRQISTNLREQLPELIDSVVRAHLLEDHKPPDDEGD